MNAQIVQALVTYRKSLTSGSLEMAEFDEACHQLGCPIWEGGESAMLQQARSECWECTFKREVPGNCHIACSNPSLDVLRHGDPHGVKNGWFFYPLLFDPTWKRSLCRNYTPVSHPVSPAVSHETSAPHTS